MNIRILLVLLLSLSLSGCTYFNGTRLESYIGSDENLISLSYKISEDLEKNAVPQLMPRNPDQPVLTTTFVDNNDLNKTSRFGRILQEHITSRFVQLGYTVKEIKLRNNLLISPKTGEIMLSRDINMIKPSLSAQGIVVGTYSYTNRIMYISARLINPETSTIVSSVDYQLVMDENVLAMFGLKIAKKDDPYTIERPRESIINKIFY
jgi:hypothetical protein